MKDEPNAEVLSIHPSSFIPHPLSLILHPSSLILHLGRLLHLYFDEGRLLDGYGFAKGALKRRIGVGPPIWNTERLGENPKIGIMQVHAEESLLVAALLNGLDQRQTV